MFNWWIPMNKCSWTAKLEHEPQSMYHGFGFATARLCCTRKLFVPWECIFFASVSEGKWTSHWIYANGMTWWQGHIMCGTLAEICLCRNFARYHHWCSHHCSRTRRRSYHHCPWRLSWCLVLSIQNLKLAEAGATKDAKHDAPQDDNQTQDGVASVESWCVRADLHLKTWPTIDETNHNAAQKIADDCNVERIVQNVGIVAGTSASETTVSFWLYIYIYNFHLCLSSTFWIIMWYLINRQYVQKNSADAKKSYICYTSIYTLPSFYISLNLYVEITQKQPVKTRCFFVQLHGPGGHGCGTSGICSLQQHGAQQREESITSHEIRATKPMIPMINSRIATFDSPASLA